MSSAVNELPTTIISVSCRTMDEMRDDKKLARRPTTRHPACDDLLTDRASSSSPVCQCLTQPAGQRDVDTVAAVHACGAVRRRQHAVRFSSVVRPPASSRSSRLVDAASDYWHATARAPPTCQSCLHAMHGLRIINVARRPACTNHARCPARHCDASYTCIHCAETIRIGYLMRRGACGPPGRANEQLDSSAMINWQKMNNQRNKYAMSNFICHQVIEKKQYTIDTKIQPICQIIQQHKTVSIDFAIVHYPRESFREGLWNHRRTFVCLLVCYHDN